MISPVTNAVVATLPVGQEPIGVAVNPVGAFVYVANYGDNTVSVINTAPNVVVATIPVGTEPVGCRAQSDRHIRLCHEQLHRHGLGD